MSKVDGGPVIGASEGVRAFPVMDSDLTGLHCREVGMSLHEYYVGQAIAGMCANQSIYGGSDNGLGKLARLANQIADELIAARKTK